MRIAIAGGGISGVTAAWQLARMGHKDVVLYEASSRLGGTVETIRRNGFILEGGPDGWVSEKPWARDLAVELGLEGELIGSNDEGRVTYVVQQGSLVPLPGSMRMMVPTDLHALEGSPLFSEAARAAYAAEPGRAEELKRRAPEEDESIATFVRRHFGEEVLAKIAGPLLSGVFGGDVERLSVRAVMPRFVQMEREHGSLINAFAINSSPAAQPVFTTLRSGTGTLIDRMVEAIPPTWVRLSTPVSRIALTEGTWRVDALSGGGPPMTDGFDHVLLALPAPVSSRLLHGIAERLSQLLLLETSSALLCTFAWDEHFYLPRGFGFLVPAEQGSDLLAGTFVDQKYPDRAPAHHRVVRAFYGSRAAELLAKRSDVEIAAKALDDLRLLLGALPEPSFSLIHRWPQSLPQYAVGHCARAAEACSIAASLPGLHLLGNAFHGVGLPDLIRNARSTALALSI